MPSAAGLRFWFLPVLHVTNEKMNTRSGTGFNNLPRVLTVLCITISIPMFSGCTSLRTDRCTLDMAVTSGARQPAPTPKHLHPWEYYAALDRLDAAAFASERNAAESALARSESYT